MRHIDVTHPWLQHAVMSGCLRIGNVPTKENLSDASAKPSDGESSIDMLLTYAVETELSAMS